MVKRLSISLLLLLYCMVVASPQQKRTLPSGAFPFEYMDRHIYLNMNFNDTVAGQWIFDTGGLNLYPDSTTFAAYGFQSKVSQLFRGAGENVVTLEVVRDTLKIDNGHLKFVSTNSPIMNLRNIIGCKPAGIIGSAIVRDIPIEINYSRCYMRILDSDILLQRGYTQIPLEVLPSGMLLLPLKLQLQTGETFEGRFVYDTGSAGGLSINTPTMKSWGLENTINNKIEHYSLDHGLGGESTQFVFRGQSVTIGGYDIDFPLVDYSMNIDGVSAIPDFDGIVGNLVLEQFDHILDISGGKLYIKPGRNYRKVSKELVSGFHSIDRRDITRGFVVVSMYKDGPAEKAGLRLGDVITHIDGMIMQDQVLAYFNKVIYKSYVQYVLSVERGDMKLRLEIRNRGEFLVNESQKR